MLQLLAPIATPYESKHKLTDQHKLYSATQQ